MMIDRIQRALERLYDLHTPHRVGSFLTTDSDWLRRLGVEPSRTPEMLLVNGQGNDLGVSLYLAPELAAALRDGVTPGSNDYLIALEGVSHFLYVVWRAERSRELTQLELELQAEVDKFVALSASGADLRGLHRRLFSQVRFRESISGEERSRYEAANGLAARFCWGLVREFGERVRHPERTSALRRFYRLGQGGKLDWVAGQSGAGP